MLVVTHEMGFARRAAHRVVFMSDGEIVEDTTPDSFFSARRRTRPRLPRQDPHPLNAADMRTRRSCVRTLGVLLRSSRLAFAACGREGAPAAPAGGRAARSPRRPGARLTDVREMQQRGRLVSASRTTSPGSASRTRPPGSTPASTSRSPAWSPRGSASPPSRSTSGSIPSAAREDAISHGDVDLYVGTYTINDSRKQHVGFAGPYFVAGQDLLVRADDTTITGPHTLQGKKVCSATGSTPIQRVRQAEPDRPEHRRVPELLAVRRRRCAAARSTP